MTKISQVIKENEEEFIKQFAKRKPYWSNELNNKAGIDEIVDFLEKAQLRLLSAFKEMVEEKRKVKSQKCTECGGKGLPTECMGGADWPYKDAYNEALKDLLSSLTQIEDDTKI